MQAFYNQLQHTRATSAPGGYWAAMAELTRRSPTQLVKNTLAWFLWG